MEYAKFNSNENKTPEEIEIEAAYMKQLTDLKQMTNDCFDQMMTFTPKTKKDSFKAFEMTQRLQAQMKALFQNYFDLESYIHSEEEQLNQGFNYPTQNSQGQEQAKGQQAGNTTNGRQINLSLKTIKKHKSWFNLSSDFIHDFAMKNPTSYAIGPYQKKIIIIENGAQLCSKRLPGEFPIIFGMIYVKPLNAYLIQLKNKIYRKDIDTNDPYVFLDVRCGVKANAIRYSDIHNRLIINKEETSVAVINLETKDIEFQVEKDKGNMIRGLKFVGQEQNKLVSVTLDGFVSLYELDFEKKVGFITSYLKLNVKMAASQKVTSMAVCDRGQYVLVNYGSILRERDVDQAIPSSIAILKVEGNFLVKKAEIELLSSKMRWCQCLECCGYSGSHVMWLGLTRGESGFTQMYDYNMETNELKELLDKRMIHKEKTPLNIHRIGNDFYYCGRDGKLMKLRIKI